MIKYDPKFFLFAIIFIFSGYLFVTPDLPLDFIKNKYAGPPSKFMALNGMQVHYRDEGDGDVILLIHGTDLLYIHGKNGRKD